MKALVSLHMKDCAVGNMPKIQGETVLATMLDRLEGDMRELAKNQVTPNENINAKVDTLAMEIKRMSLRNDILAHFLAVHMASGCDL